MRMLKPLGCAFALVLPPHAFQESATRCRTSDKLEEERVSTEAVLVLLRQERLAPGGFRCTFFATLAPAESVRLDLLTRKLHGAQGTVLSHDGAAFTAGKISDQTLAMFQRVRPRLNEHRGDHTSCGPGDSLVGSETAFLLLDWNLDGRAGYARDRLNAPEKAVQELRILCGRLFRESNVSVPPGLD